MIQRLLKIFIIHVHVLAFYQFWLIFLIVIVLFQAREEEEEEEATEEEDGGEEGVVSDGDWGPVKRTDRWTET